MGGERKEKPRCSLTPGVPGRCQSRPRVFGSVDGETHCSRGSQGPQDRATSAARCEASASHTHGCLQRREDSPEAPVGPLHPPVESARLPPATGAQVSFAWAPRTAPAALSLPQPTPRFRLSALPCDG